MLRARNVKMKNKKSLLKLISDPIFSELYNMIHLMKMKKVVLKTQPVLIKSGKNIKKRILCFFGRFSPIMSKIPRIFYYSRIKKNIN